MQPDPEPRIVDNANEERYELWIGDVLAGVLEYEARPGAMVLVHTEVDPAFQGRGLATALIQWVIADIRARGRKLVPECPTVRLYLARHREERDLVVEPPG